MRLLVFLWLQCCYTEIFTISVKVNQIFDETFPTDLFTLFSAVCWKKVLD